MKRWMILIAVLMAVLQLFTGALPVPADTASAAPLPPGRGGVGTQATNGAPQKQQEKITPADRQALAKNSAKARAAAQAAKPAAAGVAPQAAGVAPQAMTPGTAPHYFGPFANYANSQLPVSVSITGDGSGASATATVDANGVITGFALISGGSGYTFPPTVTIIGGGGTGAAATATIDATSGAVTGITLVNGGTGYNTVPGIRKFVNGLPGLGASNANDLGQYIPVAVADTTTYPDSDYYEIAVVQYREKMHSDVAAPLLRGYVQLETPVNASISKHVALANANLDGTTTPVTLNGQPVYAIDNPHYMGPAIQATKDKPVRILFRNLLPTGEGGNLFIPVDTTVMGSGPGPNMMQMTEPNPQMPMCGDNPKPAECFTENRATLHLHGGITPWISDGTPHQWITPADENTPYPKGVSVQNVPDMPDPGPGAMTFFYSNQQSARLMFYHDHAWGITRLNVLAGEAAPYLISDPMEQSLISSGAVPADQIPLVVQDKTFVPSMSQLMAEDPTWDTSRWGSTGNLWFPHVYMPAQNPGDSTGVNQFGRWAYGPWFWPPTNSITYGPIDNPYYDPNCNPDLQWCEPLKVPGVPFNSMGMEAFNDTPIVNGTAYPTLTVDPKSYRFRILNAASDRFFNLHIYKAVDANGVACDSANPNPAPQATGVACTEVKLDSAAVQAALSDPAGVFPTPDMTTAGPSFIQIGTEGGFLPSPAVVAPQPITWVTDPTVFNAGNVDKHSLLIGPAERADTIVDFSQYAGQTLILYNDSPAAFPARDPRYDYYTGNADLTSTGGAPSTLAGYGPNTRTVMQIKVKAATPAAAFDLPKLQTAFKATSLGGQGVFQNSQNPIIVGQGVYNDAYGTSFMNNGPRAGLVQIFDSSFTFDTLPATPGGPLGSLTFPLERKAIQDEMGEAFEKEYGRMSGNLGLEAANTQAGQQQNLILYPYVNPASEVLKGVEIPAGMTVTPISTTDDGTQIWKITHNGVDTHPIHFHLFDVQLINRVGWDGIIRRPDANELGWKDTVRVSPLEDTIVALRPIIPKQPFGIPDSIRPLNPMMPIGSTAMFNSTDANAQPINPPITNQVVNFGWEYVWHCHILSHEEMDMMRPISVNVSRALATAPVLTLAARTAAPVSLSWTDATPPSDLATMGNPANEIGFKIMRAVVTNGTPGAYTQVGQGLANTTSFTDNTALVNEAYSYQVVAFNAAGDSASNAAAVEALTPPAPSALAAALQNGPQVQLTWTDNANNETGFVVERADNGGAFAQIGTAPALSGTGSVNYTDTTVAAGNSYQYRVAATNSFGPSTYSNTASVSLPPVAPTALSATVNGTQVNLAWTDNAGNETGFVVERATGGGAFSQLATVPAFTGTGSVTYTDTTAAAGNTYQYRVAAANGTVLSAYSNTATATLVPAVNVPAAPTNLTATLRTGSQVLLTWRDNANNETGFVVERADNGGAFTQIATPGPRTGTGSMTYTDTSVAAGNSYQYRVAAANAGGNSGYSNTAQVTVASATAPRAPVNLTANVQAGPQVSLSWTDLATNETGFVVERADNGGAFVQIATPGARANTGTVSYTDTTVTVGNSYQYRVAAVNAGGPSAYTNTVTVSVAAAAGPAAPSGLSASARRISTTAAMVILRWTDNSNNETGFTIQRATDAGFTAGLTTTTVGAGTTFNVQSNLPRGTTYYYRVQATNASGASAWSNVVTVTTP